MAKRVWQCDTCSQLSSEKPWKCPVCGIETCDNCFERYMICRRCATGKTDEQMKALSYWQAYD